MAYSCGRHPMQGKGLTPLKFRMKPNTLIDMMTDAGIDVTTVTSIVTPEDHRVRLLNRGFIRRQGWPAAKFSGNLFSASALYLRFPGQSGLHSSKPTTTSSLSL